MDRTTLNPPFSITIWCSLGQPLRKSFEFDEGFDTSIYSPDRMIYTERAAEHYVDGTPVRDSYNGHRYIVTNGSSSSISSSVSASDRHSTRCKETRSSEGQRPPSRVP